jgi:putative tryptophan/tyrosine transport system substrate-binding protein
MRRRDFIAGLSLAAAWPVAARAQQTALPVIGFLDVAATAAHLTAAFNRGLGEQGYVDGRNVEILLRYTETYARLPALPTEKASAVDEFRGSIARLQHPLPTLQE